MGDVRHCCFDIASHDVYRSQMIDFRITEQLRFLLVSVLLLDLAKAPDWTQLAAFLGFVPFLNLDDKAKLGSHCEMGERAVDDYFEQLILEQVLLHRQQVLEVCQGKRAHNHYRADVKLVYPMGGFADPQNRPFALAIYRGGEELLLHLLLVPLWVFLPIVKDRFLFMLDRIVKNPQQVIKNSLCEFVNLFAELHSLACFFL